MAEARSQRAKRLHPYMRRSDSPLILLYFTGLLEIGNRGVAVSVIASAFSIATRARSYICVFARRNNW